MLELHGARENMRALVIAASIALLAVGINSTKNAPLDVFPEFAPPLVEVQTEGVDALVTVPMENRLNGLPRLVILITLTRPFALIGGGNITH